MIYQKNSDQVFSFLILVQMIITDKTWNLIPTPQKNGAIVLYYCCILVTD